MTKTDTNTNINTNTDSKTNIKPNPDTEGVSSVNSQQKTINKKSILYGSMSGAIIILVNIFSFEQGYSQAWLGFLVMFICLSMIFVAIKEHRDELNGGIITFKQGFVTGILVALAATVIYVLVWELYLHQTDYEFAQIYSDSVIAGQVADGASSEQIKEVEQKMAEFQQQYANPILRVPMTALEIFPVGFLISLLSAWLLRNHGDQRGS